MATEEKVSQKNSRRTTAQLAEDLRTAVSREVEKTGYAKASLNQVLMDSHISPTTFASRYGTLEEYLAKETSNQDFWVENILPADISNDVPLVRISKMLTEMLWELNKEEHLPMLHLLRWEVAEKNPTTVRTGLIRQLNMQKWLQSWMEKHGDKDFDYEALVALLMGGICYLSLHKDTSPVCGIDFNTREGMERAEKMIRQILGAVDR